MQYLMNKDMNIENFLRRIPVHGIHGIKKHLIYAASSDTFTGRKFHSKVDKKSPILMMIYLDTGLIFGGYMYSPL